MAFDVTPAPVRRRGPRIPALVVLAVGIGVVAIGIVSANLGQPASGPASTASAGAVARATATIRASTSASGPVTAPAPFPSTRGRRLPANLECHAISDAICDAIATASLAILPADVPRVVGIDAWASMLCGDSLDCPTQLFATSEPLGSAIIAFADDGPRAWVNVVDASASAAGEGTAPGPVAWIVRWQP